VGRETGFPDTHFVSTEIYTSDQIFREEQEKVFGKCWIIACHESELPSAFDYRPSAILLAHRSSSSGVRT
jgi:hypothetical protein